MTRKNTDTLAAGMLIHERMQLVQEGLMLEMDLPSVSKDKRELIISADGIPNKRNAVIALIRAAPKHLEEHWNFFAIYGREPLCNVVSNWADGVVYPYENIKFAFGQDNEKKIAIMLFLRDTMRRMITSSWTLPLNTLIWLSGSTLFCIMSVKSTVPG